MPKHSSIATKERNPNIGYGIFLILSGMAGLFAAFMLTIEKIHKLQFPEIQATCDFSIVVQCGKNLESWQGELFGFPNPLIGLIAWAVVITIGVSLLTGVNYPRWWWVAFHIGVVSAFIFTLWLINESLFSLGTLCIYCMLTWVVTIPLFWVTSLRSIKNGIYSDNKKLTQVGGELLLWSPLITLLSYIAVAVVAQMQLDVLAYL